MSDSDSDSDFVQWDNSRHHAIERSDGVFSPSEYDFDRWDLLPARTKQETGQRMKICTLWLPILLQREESGINVSWAIHIGLIEAMESEDISLKCLHRIETVEAVLRALEKGSLKRNQTKHIFWISNMFSVNQSSPEVLEDALDWLERTGEPAIRRRVLELGHPRTCYMALYHIFTEYANYIQAMCTNLERTMKSLMAQPPDHFVERSEAMKQKGNENYKKSQYEDAVQFYSKAIKYYPDNHIIYGNRAQCYIRCKKYLKAVGDGKRATLIDPLWAKGHYRYCDALFSMGEFKRAIEANSSAQRLCKGDHEGFKDLEQQKLKFIQAIKDLKGERPKSKTKRLDSTNEAEAAVKCVKPGMAKSVSVQTKVPEVKMDKTPGKKTEIVQKKSATKDPKPTKSEISSNSGQMNVGEKVESGTTAKKKSKSKSNPPAAENPLQNPLQNQKVPESKATVCKELKSLVQDAHTALADLRSRNAEQAFSQALAILETNTPKELGLSTLDVLLLLYGRTSALTEIGQPEELTEAQKLMEKMKSFEERTFQCLVFYATGRVYLKENRFTVAMDQFSDSLQMVKNQITPGKLTWPLTKEIVKETQTDYFKAILERFIEQCKFPPVPDAVCRLEHCRGSLKPEIYLTDPDFKGFIQLCCCQSCTVEYHITCWKTLKTSTFSEKNEKDFLQEVCLTPDCFGQICSIKIIGPTGLLKCKFEADILKPQTPKKPKVTQKCTSLKKSKPKVEHRPRRKQLELSFQEKLPISNEILQQNDDSATQSEQKAWLLYRDRVLLQISQNMELLREVNSLQGSALMMGLKPWLELDSRRGNHLAERMLNWQQEPLETFCQAVELLLERKNRVWARVLIEMLSSSLDVNHKLNDWAFQLNNAGLNAATSFIQRNAEHLEQLDLALLLTFGPLQEMIISKLGTRPELFSSVGLTVTEYLKQASPQNMRLFIWTLEEHREEYLTCHTILDDYFDMDGHFSVLKKSDENPNNSPVKTKGRGRKKKPRETKGVIVLSDMRSVTPREEWEQDLFEDDSLSFLSPADPFSVPIHLRDQVADFENQYNGIAHRSHYKNILDNNPDPTKERLYDYYAQILEVHGPLMAEDTLLVDELKYFPSEAQQKIQEAGSLESFLLESLRFIKMGRCIGLAKHAVSLQQAGHGAILDDLDIIVDPDSNNVSTDLHESVFPRYGGNSSSALTQVHPILPNPYTFPFKSACEVAPYEGSFYHWSSRDSPQPSPNLFLNDSELDHLSDSDVGVLDIDPYLGGVASWTSMENLSRKHQAVQTCPENMSSVAVNTEFHVRFESCEGDINKKEKSNKRLEQQIKVMGNGRVDQKHKDDLTALEEDIRKITANIQVTNRELTLLQQRLEEEVRKDQKEKKANQEVLKSLKLETEELVEGQGSLAQNIRAKNASCDAKLRDFLKLGNKSAAKKLSLEDEIKRRKASVTSATKRSLTAQLSAVESSREQGMCSLYKERADAKAFLTKLDEAAHRFPNHNLESNRHTWRSNVQEIEKKISTAETQYQQQVDQVKSGRRVSELVLSNIDNPTETPAKPPSRAARSPPLVQQPAAPAAAAAAAAPPPMQHKPPTWSLEPPPTLFDKAIEALSSIFPDYTRAELKRFVKELRSSNGGSLSNMALQDLVGGATQLILDQQDLYSVRGNSVEPGRPAPSGIPPYVAPSPVWQSGGFVRSTNTDAINVEDPCIICHDDMSPDSMCVLGCRHSFHKDCINAWLKEQSTCPTCRNHALLPDDFPALSGRRRPAP
ncbi:E3 ubiquitin-protein ligase TTC3 isoform X2 [Limanda limanda]|uniref:E3 ubiquitin-protein ligase TTC3 isoform X2 n=1 Tax=Limanda limanda TaxID=27771 RepID=UPI0029C8675F|nr:E3 ubiquitin-protein ligase TTC3 isoform X2 [Limanda limanda]